MAKLKVIDKEQFILEGEFERIRSMEGTTLDEENILTSIETYKTNVVDQGFALGCLNDGFLTMPTEVDFNGERKSAEQVVQTEKDPAFMIIDLIWDTYKRAVLGRLIILDTDEGMKVKEAINQGVECYMSGSQTEVYTVMEENTGRVLSRISNIQGYQLSLFNFQPTINQQKL